MIEYNFYDILDIYEKKKDPAPPTIYFPGFYNPTSNDYVFIITDVADAYDLLKHCLIDIGIMTTLPYPMTSSMEIVDWIGFEISIGYFVGRDVKLDSVYFESNGSNASIVSMSSEETRRIEYYVRNRVLHKLYGSAFKPWPYSKWPRVLTTLKNVDEINNELRNRIIPANRSSLFKTLADEAMKEKDKIRIEKQDDSNQSRYLDWLAESKGYVTVKEILNKALLKKEFGNFRLCGIINNDDDKECYLLISDAAYGHLTLTDNLKMEADSPKFIKFEWFVVSDRIVISSGYETTLGPHEIKYFEEKVQDFITNFIETESSTAVKYTHQYIYDGSKLIDIGNDIKMCRNCQASFEDVFRHQFGIESYDFDIELEQAEEEFLK